MRKIIIGVLTTALLTIVGPAFAGNGPAGTSETNNQVSCGEHPNAITLPAGAGRAVVVVEANDKPSAAIVACADHDAPVQGRIMAVAADGSGWAAVDGVATNPIVTGYLRLDGSGVHCGHTAGDFDSANPDLVASSDCLAAITG